MTGKTARGLDIGALAILLLIAAALAATWPPGESSSPTPGESSLVNATVSSLSPCVDDSDAASCAILDVVPSTGVDAGQVFRVAEVTGVTFSVGDKVVLRSAKPSDGGFRYAYEDHQRLPVLVAVVAVVAVGLLLAGWRHGLGAMGGLGVVAALLYFYTLPALSADPSSVAVGITTSVAASTALVFFTGGVTAPRTVAALGSIMALLAVAGVTWLIALLAELPNNLVVAGVTLGSTGAVTAIAVSQARSTFGMRATRGPSSIPHLVRTSIRANRDQVESTLATLVFANLGAGIAVLLLFASANQSALQTINSIQVALVAVAVLVGIGGMLLAVVVTGVLAASLTAGSTTTVEEIIVLDDRPPVKRSEPVNDAPRRRRAAGAPRPKVAAGEPSLWERMRQGLDD